MNLWLALHFPRLPLEVFSQTVPPEQALAVSDGQRILLCNAAATAQGVRPGLTPGAAYALAQHLLITPRHPANEQAALESLALWAYQFTSHVSLEVPYGVLLEIAGSLRLFGGEDHLLQALARQTAALAYRCTAAVAPTPRAALLLARTQQSMWDGHSDTQLEQPLVNPSCHYPSKNIRNNHQSQWLHRRQPPPQPAVAPSTVPVARQQGAPLPQGENPQHAPNTASGQYHGLPWVTDIQQLSGALAACPVKLFTDSGVTRKLRSLGVRTLGECLRLPRAGLGRRFGKNLGEDLDRLLGQRPDPQPRFQPPESFDRSLSLPAATDSAEALIFAFRRLLEELVVYLQVRVKGMQALTAQLFHREHPVTQFTLSLQRPTGDPRYVLNLLREHLERLNLPAAVLEIRFQVNHLFSLAPETTDLFAAAPSMGWSELADRLGARLGKDRIRCLQAQADYRPERSWKLCAPGTPADPLRAQEIRPLWLLSDPLPLGQQQGTLCYQGPLTLISPMERIETGWWDNHSAARDYYLASNTGGSILWVYQDRYTRTWYLQGIFA